MTETTMPTDGQPKRWPMIPNRSSRARITEGEITRLRMRHQMELEAKEAEHAAVKRALEAEAERLRLKWEKKHEEAVRRYAELERQVHEDMKARAIDESLRGRRFAGRTPEEKEASSRTVRQMVQEDFETVRRSDGALVVVDKRNGAPIEDVLRDRLARHPYRLFFDRDTEAMTCETAEPPSLPSASTRSDAASTTR